MAIYLFLDEVPDYVEFSSAPFSHITQVDTAYWMQDMGFLWCGKLDSDMTYFADSSRVTPYPDLLSRRLWLKDLMAHYRKLEQLKSSPDYQLRLRSLKQELSEVQERKEALLKPARDFAQKYLTPDNYYSEEWRNQNKRDRKGLQDLYTLIKSSPEYQAEVKREDELIASGRDLLEADSYPDTEAQAKRMMEGGEFVTAYDRIVPPTLSRKIQSIEQAIESLETLQGQKRFLSSLIRIVTERHDRVGIGVEDSLAPMPIGVCEQEEFIDRMPIPLPKRRLFIIQPKGKTA